MSQFPGEMEVLILPNTFFTVTDKLSSEEEKKEHLSVWGSVRRCVQGHMSKVSDVSEDICPVCPTLDV